MVQEMDPLSQVVINSQCGAVQTWGALQYEIHAETQYYFRKNTEYFFTMFYIHSTFK